MALKDELAYATATELAARIRRRDLSPVEVVEAHVERIGERNPGLTPSFTRASTTPGGGRGRPRRP